MKFCWATINVRDMEKSLAFYRDILGLKLIRRSKAGPEIELAFLGQGDTQVELIRDEKNTGVSFGKDISLGFIVPSVDQFAEILGKKGISLHSGPFQPNPFIKFAFILDPDGLRIQLVENTGK
jgi:lactoylglutathione lyase